MPLSGVPWRWRRCVCAIVDVVANTGGSRFFMPPCWPMCRFVSVSSCLRFRSAYDRTRAFCRLHRRGRCAYVGLIGWFQTSHHDDRGWLRDRSETEFLFFGKVDSTGRAMFTFERERVTVDGDGSTPVSTFLSARLKRGEAGESLWIKHQNIYINKYIFHTLLSPICN